MANTKKTTDVDIESDDDETIKKAKALGKEIGVVDNKNPEDGEDEYEIEVDDGEDENEDKKLGKNRNRSAPEDDDKKTDRTKLSNREKRHLRNKKRVERFEEKDQRIAAAEARAAAAEARAAEIERRQKETDSRLHGINKGEIERAFNDAQANLQRAEKDYLEGSAEGDGVKSLRALQIMKDMDDRMKLLRDTYQKMENLPEQEDLQERKPEPSRPDARIVSFAKNWAKRNDWYNSQGGDEDSEIAKAIAGVLVKEGFDPKSEDYWDELDDRLADRMPEKYSDSKHEDEEDSPLPPRRRSAPPVNGGSSRSDLKGKKTIRLPTEYIERMKREAPEIWFDPKRRKKLLDDRARIIREAEGR